MKASKSNQTTENTISTNRGTTSTTNNSNNANTNNTKSASGNANANGGHASVSNGQREKLKKLKKRKIKVIANDYLNNIQLNGQLNDDYRRTYFDNLIRNNQFNCFVYFNKISTNKREAHRENNEFFNFYKDKLAKENATRNRLDLFLQSEFEQPAVNLKQIPSINVGDEQDRVELVENVINGGDDAEYEYLKKSVDMADDLTTLATTNANLTAMGNSNMTLSSTSSTSINLSGSKSTSCQPTSSSTKQSVVKKSKSPNESSTLGGQLHGAYNRTISESSNDSCLVMLNSSSRNFGSTASRSFTGKPSFLNNLKRLTNEKILLTSNNSPIGMISRLPFRLNSLKSDLNESFLNRTRHISVKQPSNHTHNNFLIDVFDLLELNIEEYINTGGMSYSNLIDRKLKRNDDQSTADSRPVDINEEHYDKFVQVEDLNDSNKPKKEAKPFLMSTYQPDYLDDPQLTEMTAGKNRTCLKFASYAVSIIDYVKPLDLKKEINETFKEKFPYIQITLTKLRSIKREMLEIAFESSLDFVIVAQSYIYFEKLILQGLINKSNRKYLAANCLILAAKLNDTTKKDMSKLLDTIMAKFRFDSRKEMISFEFGVLVALEFNLIIKYESEFTTHYDRLMNSTDMIKLNDQYLKSNRARTFSD